MTPAAAVPPQRFLFILRLLLLSLLLPLPAVSGATATRCESPSCTDEVEVLLAARSLFIDPLNFLASWNSDTHFCGWRGVTCHNSSFHVSGVALAAMNLSGALPSSLFSLPFVETIDLSFNSLSGEIRFTVLPSSLRSLNLSNNNFTGAIYFGLDGVSSSLEVLDLSNNYFTGEIPEQLQLFSNLTDVDLGGNVLGGRIPASISNLEKLQLLTLASNQLVGEIPREIGRMATLQWVYIGYNNLSGSIPPEIGNMTALNHLDLVYNNLTGNIPSTLGNLRKLRYMFLYMNHLSGPIPPSIYNLTALISLDLSDNDLSGEISEEVSQLRELEIFHLFANQLEGKIPAAVTSLSRLKVLQLWMNTISGEIPVDLGLGSNLTVLDLSSNKLTGVIPERLCTSGQLSKLILFSNSLRGEIPRSVASCRSLQRIRLEDNLLSGKLPSEFTQLPLVYFLDLSGNEFAGRIDDRRWEMTALKMLNLARNQFNGTLPDSFGSSHIETLDLSDNSFSGPIPIGVGGFPGLAQLRLSDNLLTGPIPESITHCRKLVHVDLSNNQLSGEIPLGLSSLPELSELDLSENRFSGEIPPDLGRTQSLVSVNVSYNHLRGILPATAAFSGINSSAVAGNRGLCGGNPRSGLPACKSPRWQFSASALSGLLLLLSLSLFVLLLLRRRRRELGFIKKMNAGAVCWEVKIFDEKASKLPAVDGFLLSVKEGSILSYGRGRAAVQFAVSEVSAADHPTLGWREVAALGKFRHPDVACLVAACRSETRWVFLYEFLQGKRLGGRDGALEDLDWGQRWTIAVGVARVLHILHRQCRLAGFHDSISPENILLVNEGEAAELHLHLRLHVPGASPLHLGGLPPEAREGKELTEKSDVYSLGVLLIQLLTGRPPADPELGPPGDVVEWAHYSYAHCHVEKWVDPAMPGLPAESREQVIGVMGLAVRCTAADPKARPGMREAVRDIVGVREVPVSCNRLLGHLLPETYP